VYFVISDAENDVEEICSVLEELLKLAKGDDNLIIMGDCNAIVGKGAKGQEVGEFGLRTRNERGDHLGDFCRQNDMIIANTFQNIINWQNTYVMMC
jgi:hypothetical protein